MFGVFALTTYSFDDVQFPRGLPSSCGGADFRGSLGLQLGRFRRFAAGDCVLLRDWLIVAVYRIMPKRQGRPEGRPCHQESKSLCLGFLWMLLISFSPLIILSMSSLYRGFHDQFFDILS